MRTRTLVGVIVLALAVAACGDTATTTTTSAPAVSTTTSSVPTTTTTIASTTSSPSTTTLVTTTTTTSTTSTSAEPMTTVEAVVAYLEASFAKDFESIEPPEGVLGPGRVVCDETGPIPVGTVIACRLVPNTAPGFDLDQAGLVIYVLDETGRSAWTGGTDVPDSAAGLDRAVASAGTELFCRDLMNPDVDAGIFSGAGRPPESAYFWSLVYWSLTGEPHRMDADRNGVPCETLHGADVVREVLTGGPFN